MAARKRKLPEKKPARKEPGILAQAFAALSNTVASYPVITAGTVAFCVVFSFVAANALWYQHGGHPSPFLRTRDATNPTALIGFTNNPARVPPEDVTTFRIEREVAPPAVTANDHALALPEHPAPQAVATGAQAVLVQEIQKELARRGLYDGKADGVLGPRTSAAILFFEESVGMEQTGEPSTRILAALRIDAATVAAIPAAIPAERPSGALNAKPQASAQVPAATAAPTRPAPPANVTAPQKPPLDPVAALIRGPDSPSKPAIPVPPAPVGAPAASSESAVSGAVVMQIQRGLINIAYTDVTADGVAGARTRAAIRQFEKHYRLPETGEPSEAVLKKLKSIGAL